MKLTKLTVALVLTSLPVAALADNSGIYIGGKLGTSFQQSKDMQSHGYFHNNSADFDYTTTKDKTKATFNIGANVGYDFKVVYHVPVRAELDYTYRSDAKMNTSTYIFSSISGTAGGEYEDDHFKIKNSTLMVNGYYDFYNSTGFTPYVGLGVGASFVKYKVEQQNYDYSFSKTHFAWAAMAGVSYQIDSNLVASAEYRYLDSGKIKDTTTEEHITDKWSTKLYSHDITIGIRYLF